MKFPALAGIEPTYSCSPGESIINYQSLSILRDGTVSEVVTVDMTQQSIVGYVLVFDNTNKSKQDINQNKQHCIEWCRQ